MRAWLLAATLAAPLVASGCGTSAAKPARPPPEKPSGAADSPSKPDSPEAKGEALRMALKNSDGVLILPNRVDQFFQYKPIGRGERFNGFGQPDWIGHAIVVRNLRIISTDQCGNRITSSVGGEEK